MVKLNHDFLSHKFHIGFPINSNLSDIYLHHFKLNLFKKLFIPFFPSFVLPNSDYFNLTDILSVANSIDKHRQFIFEFENSNSLAFLNVMIFHENSVS